MGLAENELAKDTKRIENPNAVIAENLMKDEEKPEISSAIDSVSGYQANTINYERAKAMNLARKGEERFGNMKRNVARAQLLGVSDPETKQDYNDFLYKIVTPDSTGKLKIQDKRTIGWADASAASWFLGNAELTRGITARNPNNIQINRNLMYGGFNSV